MLIFVHFVYIACTNFISKKIDREKELFRAAKAMKSSFSLSIFFLFALFLCKHDVRISQFPSP